MRRIPNRTGTTVANVFFTPALGLRFTSKPMAQRYLRCLVSRGPGSGESGSDQETSTAAETAAARMLSRVDDGRRGKQWCRHPDGCCNVARASGLCHKHYLEKQGGKGHANNDDDDDDGDSPDEDGSDDEVEGDGFLRSPSSILLARSGQRGVVHQGPTDVAKVKREHDQFENAPEVGSVSADRSNKELHRNLQIKHDEGSGTEVSSGSDTDVVVVERNAERDIEALDMVDLTSDAKTDGKSEGKSGTPRFDNVRSGTIESKQDDQSGTAGGDAARVKGATKDEEKEEQDKCQSSKDNCVGGASLESEVVELIKLNGKGRIAVSKIGSEYRTRYRRSPLPEGGTWGDALASMATVMLEERKNGKAYVVMACESNGNDATSIAVDTGGEAKTNSDVGSKGPKESVVDSKVERALDNSAVADAPGDEGSQRKEDLSALHHKEARRAKEEEDKSEEKDAKVKQVNEEKNMGKEKAREKDNENGVAAGGASLEFEVVGLIQAEEKRRIAVTKLGRKYLQRYGRSPLPEGRTWEDALAGMTTVVLEERTNGKAYVVPAHESNRNDTTPVAVDEKGETRTNVEGGGEVSKESVVDSEVERVLDNSAAAEAPHDGGNHKNEDLIELHRKQARGTKYSPWCRVVYGHEEVTNESRIRIGVVRQVFVSLGGVFVYKVEASRAKTSEALTVETEGEKSLHGGTLFDEGQLAYAPGVRVRYQSDPAAANVREATVLQPTRTNNSEGQPFRYSVLMLDSSRDSNGGHVIQNDVLPSQLVRSMATASTDGPRVEKESGTRDGPIDLSPHQASMTKYPPGCRVVYGHEKSGGNESRIRIGLVCTVCVSLSGVFKYEIKASQADEMKPGMMTFVEGDLAYAPGVRVHFKPDPLGTKRMEGTILEPTRKVSDGVAEVRYSVWMLDASDDGVGHVVRQDVAPEQLSFCCRFAPPHPKNKEAPKTLQASSPRTSARFYESKQRKMEESKRAAEDPLASGRRGRMVPVTRTYRGHDGGKTTRPGAPPSKARNNENGRPKEDRAKHQDPKSALCRGTQTKAPEANLTQHNRRSSDYAPIALREQGRGKKHSIRQTGAGRKPKFIRTTPKQSPGGQKGRAPTNVTPEASPFVSPKASPPRDGRTRQGHLQSRKRRSVDRRNNEQDGKRVRKKEEGNLDNRITRTKAPKAEVGHGVRATPRHIRFDKL
ncbi:hypothetical protein ACHAWF_011675 [Thalassiosira exigua]